MKSITTLIKADVPVLLWGAPGTGKTAAIIALAKEKKAHLEVLIGSIMDPSDMGIPIVEKGEVKISPPAWARRLSLAVKKNKDSWLMLDELTCAPPAIQAALLRVVQERKCADLDLNGVKIIAAANPTDQAADGNELSLAMTNRFAHIDWAIDEEEWSIGEMAGWGNPDKNLGKIRSLTTSFIKGVPNTLCNPPDTHQEGIKGWPSPRSWSAISKAISAVDPEDPVEVLKSKEGMEITNSLIGPATAKEFISWVMDQNLPLPEDIYSGKAKLPKRGDQIYLITNMLINYAIVNDRIPDLWKILSSYREDIMISSTRRAIKIIDKAGIEKVMTSELSQIIDVIRKFNSNI
jgi:hypothetical protein